VCLHREPGEIEFAADPVDDLGDVMIEAKVFGTLFH